MSGYTVAQLDDIGTLECDGCLLRPVRHHFGITAFGVNAWTLRTVGDRLIPEHSEDSGHEELYLVVRGRAAFELDGERRDAPAGTLVFVQPGVKRTAFAEEADTAILALGGSRGQPFHGGGWELWGALRPRYEAGEYEAVLEPTRELAEANPQYPMLAYNLACLEALTGRTTDALEHLRQAIELSEQFRDFAKSDSDLDSIRDEPAFKELVRA
ncbi:MAG: TPR end-of-group domain-containing protein [Gaiellaceae bacterium]